MTLTGYAQPVPAQLSDTGATYRQIMHWVRRGLLHPRNPSPGSGFNLDWPAEEIAVASRMVEFLGAGLTLDAAHHAARNEGWLPDGTHLVLSARTLVELIQLAVADSRADGEVG